MTDDPALPASILVLGATSDIAQATLLALGAAGLETAVLAGRSMDRIAETIPALHAAGIATVATATFDADDAASHEGIIASLFADHGPFDAVLLAFGALGDPFTMDADAADAAGLVMTNFGGAVSASLASARVLADGGGGTLAIISSIAAVRPRVGNLVYGAAKAGLDAFAGGLRDAVRGSDVDVMVIRPGFVHSAMTEGLDPAPFATTPEKVAADIVAGFRDRSEVVWSPGVLRAVAPALRFMPKPLWRRVSDR